MGGHGQNNIPWEYVYDISIWICRGYKQVPTYLSKTCNLRDLIRQTFFFSLSISSMLCRWQVILNLYEDLYICLLWDSLIVHQLVCLKTGSAITFNFFFQLFLRIPFSFHWGLTDDNAYHHRCHSMNGCNITWVPPLFLLCLLKILIACTRPTINCFFMNAIAWRIESWTAGSIIRVIIHKNYIPWQAYFCAPLKSSGLLFPTTIMILVMYYLLSLIIWQIIMSYIKGQLLCFSLMKQKCLLGM